MLLLLKSIFDFGKMGLFMKYLKYSHKIEVGCAQLLNIFFTGVHLSVVLRYIYYI